MNNKRFTMPLCLISNLIMALIISTSAIDTTHLNEDIITSMREMQRASYFTFVTLLNMVQDKISHNTTFLMPSDRALSKAWISENKTLDFLLRHSIPSLLLFNDLNNVELISPNICTSGSSFRCHGIFGVLNMTAEDEKSPPTCSQASPPTTIAAAPSPQPLVGSPNSVPMISPPPVDLNNRSKKSNSSDRHGQGLFTAIVLCIAFSLMKLLF